MADSFSTKYNAQTRQILSHIIREEVTCTSSSVKCILNCSKRMKQLGSENKIVRLGRRKIIRFEICMVSDLCSGAQIDDKLQLSGRCSGVSFGKTLVYRINNLLYLRFSVTPIH